MFEHLRLHLQEIDSDLQTSQFTFSEDVDISFQRDDLWDVLSGAESVILVRTAILEKEHWIYKAVDQWAFQNSNVPIVVLDKLDRTPLPMEVQKITERIYYSRSSDFIVLEIVEAGQWPIALLEESGNVQ